MATNIEYISSFNSGYLSPLLNSRQDLQEVYRSGCAMVHNFLILSQGGVERRPATEYLLDALEGSRLLKFASSQLQSYCVEVNHEYIRIIQGTEVLVTLDSPYDPDDIPLLKTSTSIDVMTICSPNKRPMELRRTQLSPLVFELIPLEFTYPPFMEQNDDRDNLITAMPSPYTAGFDYEISDPMYDVSTELAYVCIVAHTSTNTIDYANWEELQLSDVITDEGRLLTLVATDDGTFEETQINSHMQINYPRSEDRAISSGVLKTKNVEYSNPVFMGNSEFTFEGFGENWSIRAGTYPNFYIISLRCRWAIETRLGLNDPWIELGSFGNSVAYSGTFPANTWVRIKFMVDSNGGLYSQSGTYTLTSKKSNRKVDGTLTESGYSGEFYASFSDWKIETTGTWNGVVEVQFSRDNGESWATETVLLDTEGRDPQNIISRSPFEEGPRTLIRLKYQKESGEIGYIISTDTPTMQGVVQIVEYINSRTVVVNVSNRLGGNGGTHRWSEGAYSNRRGYPTCVTHYKDRLVFAGTYTEPTTVRLSRTGDYYNFLGGTDDTHAIKADAISNEMIAWVLHKDNRLHFGTTGPMLTLEASDTSDTISPTNVKINETIKFSGSTVQGITTNETFIFLDRINRKVHEAIYDDNILAFSARDLTILSSDITTDGLVDMELTTLPEQIIFGIRGDGKIATFTYERSQNVKGWAIQDIGGRATSLAVVPTDTFDQVYIRVERETGAFIERMHTRVWDTLQDARFLDSFSDFNTGDIAGTDSFMYTQDGKTILEHVGHSFASGNLIKIYVDGYGYDADELIVALVPIDADTCYVKDVDTMDDVYLRFPVKYNKVKVDISIVPLFWNEGSESRLGFGGHSYITGDTIRMVAPNNPELNNKIYELELGSYGTVTVDQTDIDIADGVSWDYEGISSVDQQTVVYTTGTNGVLSIFKYQNSMHVSMFIGAEAVDYAYAMPDGDKHRYTFRQVDDTILFYLDDVLVDTHYLSTSTDFIFTDVTEVIVGGSDGVYVLDGDLTSLVVGNIQTLNSCFIRDIDHHNRLDLGFPQAPNSDHIEILEVSNVFVIPHLPNTIVQCVGDNAYNGAYVTDGTGSITTDTYYNKAYVGIPMISVVQPMYLESSQVPSLRMNKTVIDAVVRFHKTIGGISGIVIQPGDDDPVLNPADFTDTNTIPLERYEYEPLNFRTYTDEMGEVIEPSTGTKIVSYNDSHSRIKSLFIAQNIPMPMTVQSIGVSLGTGT